MIYLFLWYFLLLLRSAIRKANGEIVANLECAAVKKMGGIHFCIFAASLLQILRIAVFKSRHRPLKYINQGFVDFGIFDST